MTEATLIPKQVTVTSEVKFFGLDRGASDGSGLTVTFDIPPGISRKDLERMIWVEKERLDLQVLIAERVKESITEENFKHRVERMKATYAKLVGREVPAPVPAQPAEPPAAGDEIEGE